MNDAELRNALAALIGDENVQADSEALRQATGSWQPALVKARQTGADKNLPAAVVTPGDANETARIVRWANDTRTRLHVVGGASNTVGSNRAEGENQYDTFIVVDTRRLKTVDWEEENLLVHAGAGVNLGELEEQLNAHDYTLGHLPHSLRLATVGGSVATNAIGILSGRYGRQSDLTRGLHVVLPTGALLETAPTNAPGANAAFNMHNLFIGGEGAFGIVTQATLQMRPIADVRAWAAFSFASFDDGMDALRLIYRSDSRPALARLFGKTESQRRLDGSAGFLLLLMFEGDELVQTGPYQVAYGVCQAVGGKPQAQAADLGDNWWSDNLKTGTSWLAANGRPTGLADGFAFSAPWSNLKSVRRAVEAALTPLVGPLDTHIAYAYPAGAALDVKWQTDAPSETDAPELLARITNAGLTAAQNAGASVAHHYGVGSARRDAFARERGASGMAALRAIQAALDPNGVFRPAALI